MVRNKATWRPIFEGEVKEKALDVVLDIASALQKIEVSDPSLASGNAGISIFFHYLDRIVPGHGFDETSIDFLNKAISQMGSQELDLSFYSGISGIGWAAEHIQRNILEENEKREEDVNEEIDKVIGQVLSNKKWYGHFDLVRGIVGIGVYLLERPLSPVISSCIERTIFHLGEMARQRGKLMVWPTPLAFSRIKKHEIDLGMAHGLPGILAYLAHTSRIGIVHDQSLCLLKKALDTLNSQKLTQKDVVTKGFFPHVRSKGLEQDQCRIAWCYGDLGVALGLFLASRALKRQRQVKMAISIAEICTRRPIDLTGVTDSGLCHGAAGLLHIFNRFFQLTNNVVFHEAAVIWYSKLVGFRKPENKESLAGFSTFIQGEKGQIVAVGEPGILSGVAGIGLSILSACSKQELSWDKMLLSNLDTY